MRIGLDLDGTIYDTFEHVFQIQQNIRKKLGYDKISREKYKKELQSENWNKLYRNLGIQEEHIEEFTTGVVQQLRENEQPPLISGARETIQELENKVSSENIHIITNAEEQTVRTRFERDGLDDYLSNLRAPDEGKKEEFIDIVENNGSEPFIYIGDLASDGRECVRAYERTDSDIRFYGITHEYSMNHPRQLVELERQHSICETIDDVQSITSIIQ